MKILMVCLGNICRSPMAEGVLRHHAMREGLSIEIDSAGTGNYHIGEKPDTRAIRYLLDQGIDISSLRARQFHADDFEEFDIIYTMDESNHSNVLKLAKSEEHRNKVRMILNEVYTDENRPVPDPYFGGIEGFEEVYQLLNTSSSVIINNIKNRTK